jgi:hypothetical protein
MALRAHSADNLWCHSVIRSYRRRCRAESIQWITHTSRVDTESYSTTDAHHSGWLCHQVSRTTRPTAHQARPHNLCRCLVTVALAQPCSLPAPSTYVLQDQGISTRSADGCGGLDTRRLVERLSWQKWLLDMHFGTINSNSMCVRAVCTSHCKVACASLLHTKSGHGTTAHAVRTHIGAPATVNGIPHT